MADAIITTAGLNMSFGDVHALQDVDLSVPAGSIGLVGANGAGKSTLIKILLGMLEPSAGTTEVYGTSAQRKPLAVRSRVGYMPENVPLYLDMRVGEYLRFRAEVKGLGGRKARHAVDEAMDICGLQTVRKKLINNLSKGFRQRVGLADALVNKPELLILDEPTNGLDPNQIRQVRELIKQLGERHTILISTHILHEVEMTCGRVIIVDRGHIKASDTPANLVRRLRAAGTVSLEVKFAATPVLEKIRALTGVKTARHVETRKDWAHIEIRTESNFDVRQDLHDLAVAENWPLRELSLETASIEDVFVDMTHPDASNGDPGAG